MRTKRALAKQTTATYAAALFEAAKAEDAVFAMGTELDEAAAVVRGHADLRDALLDDNVAAQARRDIVTQVFSGSRPALVAALGVMAERGNIDLLSSVVEAYGNVAEERLNVVIVDTTTVVPLTDGIRGAIKNKLVADFGKDVVLREHVDTSIIGGIIMSAHGRRVDASIVSQLDRTRMALSTAHTGGEA
ncbi:MAG: ATP synthase F1 subunit delta [Coriobacteriales bacterium]|nr:ATP synthase F1 subunit delta [Coriobacteriales bacterium]